MKRKATVAALSAGLLVLVPGVQAERPPARTVSTNTDARPAAVPPIPPEDPTVVGSSLEAGSWSRRFHARPEASVSLSGAVLAAYQRAVAASPPECHLTVSLLAAIGQVESGNLAGHHLGADNRVVPAILGPVLNGRRFRAVPDTDAGRWDGNTRWDRALGPLQFIPASWRAVGVDLDGDGVRDPQDLDDAAGAAMVYLCAGGRDLATDDGLRAAILSYNHSTAYLRLVLAWKAAFDGADLAGWGSAPLATAWSAILAAPAGSGSSTPVVPTSTPRPGKPAVILGHHTLVTAPHPVTNDTATPPSPIPAAPQPSAAPPPPPVSDPGTVPPVDACPTPTDPAAGGPTVPDPAPSTPTPTVGGPTPTPDPCPVADPTVAPDPVPTPVPTPTPDPVPTTP